MAIPTRLIKRRIKSIRSTKKIMKAMELVAASKMRRATQLTLATRPYTGAIQRLTEQLRNLVTSLQHPLLVGRSNGSAVSSLMIVAASDRGLCGGFNNQILKKSLEFIKARRSESIKVLTVGRRAEQVVKRAGYDLFASFESLAAAPSFERAHPIGSLILQEFLSGTFQRIFMSYTHFQSALRQVPNVIQILPVLPEKEIEQTRTIQDFDPHQEQDWQPILWEPTPDQILDKLLPRSIEMLIYQGLLESSASEQSARMMAMRSAGEAAGEMLDDLTFSLNQARQATITREISEISAGKAAVE